MQNHFPSSVPQQVLREAFPHKYKFVPWCWVPNKPTGTPKRQFAPRQKCRDHPGVQPSPSSKIWPAAAVPKPPVWAWIRAVNQTPLILTWHCLREPLFIRALLHTAPSRFLHPMSSKPTAWEWQRILFESNSCAGSADECFRITNILLISDSSAPLSLFMWKWLSPGFIQHFFPQTHFPWYLSTSWHVSMWKKKYVEGNGAEGQRVIIIF